MSGYTVIKMPVHEWVKNNPQLSVLPDFRKKIEAAKPGEYVLSVLKNGGLAGFVFCRPSHEDTVYLRTSGTMELKAGILKEILNYCFNEFKLIRIKCFNDDTKTLDVAMKVGFLVNGTYTTNTHLIIELELTKAAA